MKNEKAKNIISCVVTTVFLGLLVYAAYSLWYVFSGTESGFDVHLYTVLSGSALGWFFVMFIQTLFKNAGWIKKLIAFLAGNALFQGVIWGINAKINSESYDNDEVVIRSFTVAFILSAVLLLITFIVKAKNKNRILNAVLAIIYFTVSCAGACTLNMENIRAIDYKKNIKFDTVSAEEMNITAEEKSKCLEWYKNNFFSENGDYPFTFKIDGEEFIQN